MVWNRRQGFVLFVLISLIIFSSASIAPFCEAEKTNWITKISIRDLTANTLVQEGAPLLAGHSYNCTFTVEVPFSQADSVFTLTLNPDLSLYGSQYWYLHTQGYGGYDAAKWTPGSKAIQFKQIEGKISISSLFNIPLSLTLTSINSVNYRYMRKDLQVVGATVAGGSQVGALNLNISDSAIETYLVTVSKKATLISSGQLDKTYESILNSVLQQAQSVYEMGLVEKATDILNLVNPTAFPPPTNTSMNTILYVGLGLLGVVAVASLILFSRAKSKQGFTQAMIDQARSDLAGLEVSVAKLDSRLANEVKSIKDKLGEGE